MMRRKTIPPERMNPDMKKIIALLIALLLLAGTAAAETKITVSGTGETQVSADTAVISLGVSIRDKDVLQAQQKVNEAIAAVRKALSENGVEEDCVSTGYMNIYANYDYGYSGGEEQVSSYNAQSTLSVKVTDMEKVGLLIDVSFAAGANTLHGITFSASDTEEAGAESLKKAVADARAKAEILAGASGLKITEIENISEGGVYSYDNTVGNFSAKEVAADEAAGTVVSAAKLIVSASVTITFEAE